MDTQILIAATVVLGLVAVLALRIARNAGASRRLSPGRTVEPTREAFLSATLEEAGDRQLIRIRNSGSGPARFVTITLDGFPIGSHTDVAGGPTEEDMHLESGADVVYRLHPRAAANVLYTLELMWQTDRGDLQNARLTLVS